MKFFAGSLVIAVLFLGCHDRLNDSSSQFPECVGIIESFDPNDVINPYFVTLQGSDTIKIRMIFTNYTPGSYFSYIHWSLWVATDSSGYSSYYEGFCSQSFPDKKWYANSEVKYKGQLALCNFEFEIFTCRQVSGSCYIIESQTRDTLYYNFAGTKL